MAASSQRGNFGDRQGHRASSVERRASVTFVQNMQPADYGGANVPESFLPSAAVDHLHRIASDGTLSRLPSPIMRFMPPSPSRASASAVAINSNRFFDATSSSPVSILNSCRPCESEICDDHAPMASVPSSQGTVIARSLAAMGREQDQAQPPDSAETCTGQGESAPDDGRGVRVLPAWITSGGPLSPRHLARMRAAGRRCGGGDANERREEVTSSTAHALPLVKATLVRKRAAGAAQAAAGRRRGGRSVADTAFAMRLEHRLLHDTVDACRAGRPPRSPLPVPPDCPFRSAPRDDATARVPAEYSSRRQRAAERGCEEAPESPARSYTATYSGHARTADSRRDCSKQKSAGVITMTMCTTTRTDAVNEDSGCGGSDMHDTNALIGIACDAENESLRFQHAGQLRSESKASRQNHAETASQSHCHAGVVMQQAQAASAVSSQAKPAPLITAQVGFLSPRRSAGQSFMGAPGQTERLQSNAKENSASTLTLSAETAPEFLSSDCLPQPSPRLLGLTRSSLQAPPALSTWQPSAADPEEWQAQPSSTAHTLTHTAAGWSNGPGNAVAGGLRGPLDGPQRTLGAQGRGVAGTPGGGQGQVDGAGIACDSGGQSLGSPSSSLLSSAATNLGSISLERSAPHMGAGPGRESGTRASSLQSTPRSGCLSGRRDSEGGEKARGSGGGATSAAAAAGLLCYDDVLGYSFLMPQELARAAVCRRVEQAGGRAGASRIVGGVVLPCKARDSPVSNGPGRGVGVSRLYRAEVSVPSDYAEEFVQYLAVRSRTAPAP